VPPADSRIFFFSSAPGLSAQKVYDRASTTVEFRAALRFESPPQDRPQSAIPKIGGIFVK